MALLIRGIDKLHLKGIKGEVSVHQRTLVGRQQHVLHHLRPYSEVVIDIHELALHAHIEFLTLRVFHAVKHILTHHKEFLPQTFQTLFEAIGGIILRHLPQVVYGIEYQSVMYMFTYQ